MKGNILRQGWEFPNEQQGWIKLAFCLYHHSFFIGPIHGHPINPLCVTIVCTWDISLPWVTRFLFYFQVKWDYLQTNEIIRPTWKRLLAFRSWILNTCSRLSTGAWLKHQQWVWKMKIEQCTSSSNWISILLSGLCFWSSWGWGFTAEESST